MPLSKHQLKIVEAILDGAEIQVENNIEKTTYTLCYEGGDIEEIKKPTFEKLVQHQMIKLKYRPSIDIERWY